jgi:hypothetical protein
VQRVGQQEHALGGRPALEIDERYGFEFVGERSGPVVEHVGNPDAIGDPEREVQVGQVVAGVDGERAHEGSGDDARIVGGEPKHTLAQSIPVRNREPGSI